MITIAIAVVVLVALYIYGTRTFNYWKDRGIKHDRPLPLIGNNSDLYLMKKSVSQVAEDLYWRYPNERVVGFFRSSRPELVIRDPVIVKRILTTDFSSFYARGLNPHKTVVEPMLRNLFFADGDLWRLLRQRITPAFTSGKLKAMFPLIVERAEKLRTRIGTTTSEAKSLDARELMARYTTDFIGAVGFGLDTDSLNDENSAFRKLGAKIFQMSIPLFIISMLKEFFPEITKNLKVMYRFEKELVGLVQGIQKQRNFEPSNRHDFIDLLMEAKKKGTMVGDSIERTKPDGSPELVSIEMTDELIAAQVFVFFAAGFETSSSTTSYTLHQLAYNPEVQKKVQDEIDKVLSKHGNKLSYDAIKEMTYLEWTFKEGMRKFPSLGFLIREASRQYTIPDMNVTIDPGVRIIIPLQGLQMDPQYFVNPEEFRPERFSPEEFDSRNNFVYLPFGEGPRACVGERLALMQSLAGLAAVLSKFTVEPAPETRRKLQIEPKSGLVQTVKGGIPLIFRERKIPGTSN